MYCYVFFFFSYYYYICNETYIFVIRGVASAPQRRLETRPGPTLGGQYMIHKFINTTSTTIATTTTTTATTTAITTTTTTTTTINNTNDNDNDNNDIDK